MPSQAPEETQRAPLVRTFVAPVGRLAMTTESPLIVDADAGCEGPPTMTLTMRLCPHPDPVLATIGARRD